MTSRVRLATAVSLPVEHDPITLAKSIATLDHLSGGRVTLGVGFSWNTDEMADHNVPPGRRRTMLREYIEAMRELWTRMRPPTRRVRRLRTGLGVAETGPVTCPGVGRGSGQREELQVDFPERRRLDHHSARPRPRRAHQAVPRDLGLGGRPGAPEIVALDFKPVPESLPTGNSWGVTEVLFGLPDRSADDVAAYVERLSGKAGGALVPCRRDAEVPARSVSGTLRSPRGLQASSGSPGQLLAPTVSYRFFHPGGLEGLLLLGSGRSGRTRHDGAGGPIVLPRER